MHGQFSIKSDVLLLLEILSGQKNICMNQLSHPPNILLSRRWLMHFIRLKASSMFILLLVIPYMYTYLCPCFCLVFYEEQNIEMDKHGHERGTFFFSLLFFHERGTL